MDARDGKERHMYRRIMVPLDGSARAESALPVAARLARESGATIYFVDVANVGLDYGPMLGPAPFPQEVIDRAYDETVAYLKAVVGRADLAGIATETEVLSGPVADTLLGAAQAHHADLIVMNSHGRSGLTRWALGSVAEHLVHHAPGPVVVLRESEAAGMTTPAAAVKVWRALVGLDGSPLAEAALAPTVDLIRALAAPARGELHLVRVVGPAPAPEDEMTPLLGGVQRVRQAHDAVRRDAEAYLRSIAERAQAAEPGQASLHTSWVVIEARDVATALIQAAEGLQGATGQPQAGAPAVTMIALATHGRGGIARWALGSVAERVIEGTRLPALIVRPAEVLAQQRAAEAEPPASARPQLTAPLFPPWRRGRGG
jgi:nucleotide-binding universal stress UspA family protein